MRFLFTLLITALPASAWEFSPLPICTLDHVEDDLAVRVTYDPATELYAITLTRPQGWPADPTFSIRFDGGRPLTISTTRHDIDPATISVTDTGFGNVLNGLQFNTSATAFTATGSATFSLEGAANPVLKFRECATAPVA